MARYQIKYQQKGHVTVVQTTLTANSEHEAKEKFKSAHASLIPNITIISCVKVGS